MPLSSAVWAPSSERSSRVSSPISSSSTTIRYGTSGTYGGCVSYSRRAASSLTVVGGGQLVGGRIPSAPRKGCRMARTVCEYLLYLVLAPSSRTHPQGVSRTEVVPELSEVSGSPS